MPGKIFIGTIINPSNRKDSVEVINGYIIVDNSKIIAIGDETLRSDDYKDFEVETLTESQFLIPGLIDTHIHAPQYPNAGLGYDVPLLQWLDKYTYNLESKYNDLQYSKRVYDAVVRKTLSFGTTTACYFGSMFSDSSLVLVDSVIEQGQRAYVGKINMTRLAPENYIETPEQSLLDTELFIKKVLSQSHGLVQPIITPRFALSLDMNCMEQLGALASKYDLNIQSHISENTEEVELVKTTYKECKHYVDVYDKANLLTSKTVLAHGIHLGDDEMKMLAEKNTSISHCPNSNTRLRSGLCNVRSLQKMGINVALGTDISGGASASIIDAMRCALDTSIHLSHLSTIYQPLNVYEAFYMATVGGAKALAIDDKVGTLEVGKEFDAVLVDVKDSLGLLDTYTPLDLFQKFVYLGDDRNVKNVFVAGRKVK